MGSSSRLPVNFNVANASDYLPNSRAVNSPANTLSKNNLNILNLPSTFLSRQNSSARVDGPKCNLESDLSLDDK
jgi:hypothetical protein